MNISRKLLLEKKWAFILIFFILLFNPCFFFWAENVNIKDKCMTWVTCLVVGLALSCIDLFLKKRGEKLYLSILFILSIVPNIIVWSYLFISRLYMKRDMYWVIFTSHTGESTEFLREFISWELLVAGFSYLLLGLFFLLKARSVNSISPKKYGALLILSIAIVLTSMFLQYLSQAIPTFELYKSRILFWKENLVFQQEKELRKNLKMEVQCLLPDSTQHVVVVLLGESTTACHMSLYGYPRETTPFMDSLKDELDVYTDVITPDTHTFGVMQKVLTFADNEHPEYFRQKPSIVEMFNSAGFETYWISNKAFLTKWGGSYGIIAEESKHIYDLSSAKKTDEVVVPYLEKILNDSIRSNKIIFIHVMGNHHEYNCRYPNGFEYFDYKKRGDLEADFRNDHMKKTIDEYDNSIRYGDFVYHSILQKIKEKKGISSYFLFFSDHGEEVYDTRDARGHFMDNVYPCQCKIPFVLWRSEQYKKEVPEVAIDTTRPYSIEHVIFSLSTLCRLQYTDYDPEKSIFSPEYKVPEKRMVGKEDYDNEIVYKIKK